MPDDTRDPQPGANRLDPDAWYSDMQLRLEHHLDGLALAHARDTGGLRYVVLGGGVPDRDSYMYRGAWVLDWLNSHESRKAPRGGIYRAADGRAYTPRRPPKDSGSAAPTTAAARSVSHPASVSPGSCVSSIRSVDPMSAQDPIQAFDAAVREKMAGGMTRQEAIRAIAVHDPALHRAYLVAMNPSARLRRLISEKYDDAA